MRWLPLLSLMLLTACSPEPTLELTLTYGSEKQAWINTVTERFNNAGIRLESGERIVVQAIPMGSGESMREILDQTRQTHLSSPASSAFVELANDEAREQGGEDILGPTHDLVLSPVVIAMWQPMAEALGWPEDNVGWGDILQLARDPQGWASRGQPQWGSFKFAHTHPLYSNSGLISLLAEVYAATGKRRGLSLRDLENPEVATFLRDIERSVVHYGRSTGFFGRKMIAGGPEYLSAAVLYENMIIEAQQDGHDLVALYPEEGTFWSDHPIGIVQAPWVSAQHREAAEHYIDFLLQPAQQQAALASGFRPADPSMTLGSPIDTAHGVDPQQPQTTLRMPEGRVIRAVLDLWREHKKHAQVVLVLDTSGSMQHDGKMAAAREGAHQLIQLMNDRDLLTLLPFNHEPYGLQRTNLVRNTPLGEARDAALAQIRTLNAAGGTALYDAVHRAHAFLQQYGDPERIQAIVVLSDGADEHSNTELATLLDRLALSEANRVRVFPIAYGQGARLDVLEGLANASGTEAYSGDATSIQSVFRDISTFF